MVGRSAQTDVDGQEADRIWRFLASSPQYGNSSCTRAVLRALMLKTGGRMLAVGHQWDIVAKHIGAGVYRVSAKIVEPHSAISHD